MDFMELLNARSSAVNFDQNVQMSEGDFTRIFEATKTAPSAYNLQFTKYLVVLDKDKKDLLYELNFQQHKIRSASAIVLVLGDKQSTSQANAEKVYSPMKMLRMMSDTEYNSTLELISYFDMDLQNHPDKMLAELNRHAGIHVALLMLSAKYHGFDSCPMHLHNVGAVREAFQIPEHLDLLMMVAVGKSVDKKRLKGYRKPVGEFVQFHTY